MSQRIPKAYAASPMPSGHKDIFTALNPNCALETHIMQSKCPQVQMASVNAVLTCKASADCWFLVIQRYENRYFIFNRRSVLILSENSVS